MPIYDLYVVVLLCFWDQVSCILNSLDILSMWLRVTGLQVYPTLLSLYRIPDQIQDFRHARQALYQLNYIFSPEICKYDSVWLFNVMYSFLNIEFHFCSQVHANDIFRHFELCKDFKNVLIKHEPLKKLFLSYFLNFSIIWFLLELPQVAGMSSLLLCELLLDRNHVLFMATFKL